MPNISVCHQMLVIGATAGLGLALSLANHDLPSSPRVVVAGRRLERLEELATEERIDAVQLDVSAPREELVQSVNGVTKKFPGAGHFLCRWAANLQIDGIIFSAGIQRHVDFTKPDTVDHDCELRLSGPAPQLMLNPTQAPEPSSTQTSSQS